MKQEWHIDIDNVDGKIFIQEWHTLNEITVEEAERRLSLFDQLVETLVKAKSSVEWMADAVDSDPEDQELLEIVNNAIAKAKGG